MKKLRIKLTPVALLVINSLGCASAYAAEAPVSCYADNTNRTFHCAEGSTATEKNTLAIGLNASTTGPRAIAIGAPDNGMNTNFDNVTPRSTRASADGIAIGTGATVTDEAPGGVAIGSRRHQPGGSNSGSALGGLGNAGAIVNAINGVAIGTGAVSGSAGKGDFRTVAIGDSAKVSGNLNTGLGPGLIVGDGSDSSVAVGYSSAIGRQSPGNSTFENASKATAVGYGAEVMKGSDRSTGLGSQARVLQGTTQSLALGNNSVVNAGANNSTAIGSYASVGTGALNAIALGGGSDANNAAKVSQFATEAIAIGSQATASGEKTVVIGAGANAAGGASNGIAMGHSAAVSGMNGMALGQGAKASGTNSTAVGEGASAANTNALAFGTRAQAKDAESIAIGHNATAQNSDSAPPAAAIAIGKDVRAIQQHTLVIGEDAGALSPGAIAFGHFATAGNSDLATRGNDAIAVGSFASAPVQDALALGNGAMATGVKGIAMGRDTKASAENTVAVGLAAEASGANAIALGNGSEATAENAISIGKGNRVRGINSGAIGDPSTVSGASSYSFGNNNTITGNNAFVLGNGVSNAVDNSVVLGNGSAVSAAVATPAYTVNGVSHAFAGSVPASTVSIGDAGKERTLTNVAAGRISGTSTDAVNGSQLFAVTSEVDKGSQFAGNTGTFNRRLGDTTTISGGLAADAAASNKNIRTEAKDGLIDIQLADNLDVTSVKAGNSLLDNDGLHITGGPSVTTGGIDAGNKAISNVGDAVNDTDAVNKRQFDNLSTTVGKGWSLQANGGDAEAVAPGDTVNVAEGDNIQVTRTGKTLNIATARKVNFDSVAVGDIALDKDTGKISGLSEGILSADSKDAVTGGQLFSTNENVAANARDIAAGKAQLDSGLNFTGNTGTFNRRLGDTTTISGGLAADAAASNKNIRTEAKDGLIDIQLADNLDVTSVKAGNSLLDNDGLHITGGPSVTAGGIDAGNKAISNVGDAVNDTDAVNKRQFDNLSMTVGQGLTFAANEGSNITRKPGEVLALKGDATAAGSYSGGNIKTVTDPSTGMISIQMADSPVFGSVVINDNNSGKITGVSDGTIGEGSQDVVNGGQIHRVTTSIGNVIGGDARVDADGSLVASNIGNTGKSTLHDAIDSVRSAAETAGAGWNLSVNGEQSGAVKPKDTVDLNNTDGNISITKKDNQVSFNLSDSVKFKDSVGVENGPSLTRTGIDGAGMKITNVADGTIAAGSKDAVNGGQIHDFVSGEVTRPMTFAADSGTPYEARLGTTVNVKGDDKNIHTAVNGNTLSVSLNENINVKSVTATESLSVASGASVDMGGNPVHNVGNATRPGDAVNYGQFQQAFSSLGSQINRVERRANAGAAAAIATAGLTQAYAPGKSMMSMSGGTFQGESSLAIGLSTISDNGNWVLKGSFSSTTRNQTGASVGVGFQF